jgi:hypothetical protein
MRKLLNKLFNKFGLILIPIKPTEALLESMAVRNDHSFCAPGWFGSDEEILAARKSEDFSVRLTATQTLTSTEKKNALITMRQLHEEVVGRGFYKYD